MSGFYSQARSGAEVSRAEEVLTSFLQFFFPFVFFFHFFPFVIFPFFSFSLLPYIFLSFCTSFPSHVFLAFAFCNLSVLKAPIHICQALSNLPTCTAKPRENLLAPVQGTGSKTEADGLRVPRGLPGPKAYTQERGSVGPLGTCLFSR